MDAMRWGLLPLSYPVDAASTCMDALSYPQQRAPQYQFADTLSVDTVTRGVDAASKYVDTAPKYVDAASLSLPGGLWYLADHYWSYAAASFQGFFEMLRS